MFGKAKFQFTPMFVFSFIVIFVTVIFTGYVFIQKASLVTNVSIAEAELKKAKDAVVELQEKGVDTALSARHLIEKIDKQYFEWSQVIQRVQGIVPKTSSGAPTVDFLSYAGSRDGRIVITSRTVDSSKDPYSDTADLIAAFNGSDYFSDAFVPSISKTVLENGATVLNYSLQLVFVEEAVLKSAAGESDATQADDGSTPVPRKNPNS